MRSNTVLPIIPEAGLIRNKQYIGLLLQFALFFSMFGLVAGAGAGDGGGSGRQLLWGAFGLVAVTYYVVSLLSEDGNRVSFGGWPMAMILTYACLSISWSNTPSVTLKRSILLVILAIVCAVSTGRWSKDWRTDSFSRLLATPMAWLMGLSLLLTIAMPGHAFTDIGWRGITSHKNEAGQMAAFAVLLAVYGVCHEKLGIYLRSLIVLVSFACLVLAQSTTSLLGVVIGIGLTELVMARSTVRKLGSWKIGILGAALVISGLLFFAFQIGLLPSVGTIYSKFLSALGKSDTFTGRTAIWDLVLRETRLHSPWLGGGYGGFWNGRDSISGYVLIGNLYPGQAHNGYVDMYNDLGYVGLGLIGVMMIVALYRIRTLVAVGHPETRLHMVLIFYCLFLNLGESTLLRSVTFVNIIMFASFTRIAAIASQARAEATKITD